MNDAFPELVGLIYAAIGQPEGWRQFLLALSDRLAGASTTLHGQDVDLACGHFEAAARFDPSFSRSFGEHYSQINPFMVGQEHLLTTGTVVTGPMVCPDRNLVASEYWNDWMRPQQLFHLLGGVPLREGSVAWTVSALRSRCAGPYTDEDTRLLTDLLPHLRRAIQLHQRLAGLQMRGDLSVVALDQLAHGVIVLDVHGRALLVNRTAQEILDAHDGLAVAPDGLHAARSQETTALRRLVHAACENGAGSGVKSSGALALPRPSGKRALSFLVAPLARGTYLFVRQDAAAIAFVSDPERAVDVPVRLLQSLHELTHAEARLANLLLQGRTLAAAGEQLGVSLHTVRNQVRSVFGKTDTHSQGELLLLLARELASLRR